MEKKYFTDANSALGFRCLKRENLSGIIHVFHLESTSITLVHRFLIKIVDAFEAQGWEVEKIFNPFNVNLLAGIVCRAKSIGIVSDGEVFNGSNVINLDVMFDGSKLVKIKKENEGLTAEFKRCYETMYNHFSQALVIHDEWEKVYIDHMDFKKANEYRFNVLTELFAGIKKRNRESLVTKRFFGASTSSGLYDFVPELTTGLKRYLIKGRPGSGKSTIMKAVMKKAAELGLDMEVYQCSLDPKSLDMVLIPELNVCIFDATPPHEYEATFETDKVLDTYEAFINPIVEITHKEILDDIAKRYKHAIKSGLDPLKKADELIELIEDKFIVALNVDEINSEFEKILVKIFSVIN